METSKSFYKNIIQIYEVDSTNNFASRLISENKGSEGTIIVAKKQISGKGQADNKWESEDGKNLTFSIILKPDFLEVACQFMISKMVSLSLMDFLKNLSIDNISIKWPNDIYIGNNKIAGILIENSIKGIVYNYAIVGIGININQTQFSSGIPNPVSLKLIFEKELNIDECLKEILDVLETRYTQLKENKFKLIDNDYLNSLYNFNIWASYIYKNQKIMAKIVGVNKFGTLLLIKEDATTIECDIKEIKYII